MSNLLSDIIRTGRSQENLYDGFMGFFGGGIKNRNYVPSVDPITGKVEKASWQEQLAGINDEEKAARHAELQQQALKQTAGYEALVNEGVTPELTIETTASGLNKKGVDLKETVTAQALARRYGASEQDIATIRDGGKYGADITAQLYGLADNSRVQQERERLKSSPEWLEAQSDKAHNRRLEREALDYKKNRDKESDLRYDLAQDRLHMLDMQNAQLRRDQQIESKEARLAQQELAMLTLNRDERMHNQRLEYQRELDSRKRTDNIAAALSSLAMSFFA